MQAGRVKIRISAVSSSCIVAVLFFTFGNTASAIDLLCVDDAATEQELQTCTDTIIPALETELEKELSRLKDIYQDNEEMLFLIDHTKKSWENYKDAHCILEAAATAGGKAFGQWHLAADKKYVRCVVHKLKELKTGMSRL